jgi:hypothetical protein
LDKTAKKWATFKLETIVIENTLRGIPFNRNGYRHYLMGSNQDLFGCRNFRQGSGLSRYRIYTPKPFLPTNAKHPWEGAMLQDFVEDASINHYNMQPIFSQTGIWLIKETN